MNKILLPLIKYIFGLYFISWADVAIGQVDKNTTYRISYMMYYQRDSIDMNTKMNEAMELFTDGKKSVFRSTEFAYLDSFRNEFNPINKVPLTGKSSSYSIEKDFIKEKLSYYGSIRYGNRDFYKYEENMSNMVWSLHEDTSTINGIKCQKATIEYGGRNWVAWFTTDIPIQDGPYKFGNLPGLIVNVHSLDGYWRFELTDIHQVAQQIPEIFLRMRAEQIQKKSYYKLKRDYLYNIVAIEEASGNSVFVFESDEDRRRVIEGIKGSALQDNNWIELYP